MDMQMRSVEYVPALMGDTGHDVSTGVAAPLGRRFYEEGGVGVLPSVIGKDMGQITDRGRSVVEVADLWQPGDPDQGITVRVRDGSIVPRIDHLRCVIPLRAVTGEDLGLTDRQIEMARRDWYAQQVRARPRLVPVHHIIGPSDPAWWGLTEMPTPSALEDREAWLALFWEPEAMLKLTRTHASMFALDWGRLPERAILGPLDVAIKRAGKARDDVELRRLNLRRDRARADLRAITMVGQAVIRAAGMGAGRAFDQQMQVAREAHADLAKQAAIYNDKAAQLDQIRVN